MFHPQPLIVRQLKHDSNIIDFFKILHLMQTMVLHRQRLRYPWAFKGKLYCVIHYWGKFYILFYHSCKNRTE